MSQYAPLAVDLAIVMIIAISALLAYARGFVREFLTIAALVAAAIATYYLFPYAWPYVRRWVSSEPVADAVTIIGLGVGVLVLVLLVTHPLAERARGSNLGFLDRWLGFAWGVVRGGLIVLILYVPLSLILPFERQPLWLRDAQLMQYVRQWSEILAEWGRQLLASLSG